VSLRRSSSGLRRQLHDLGIATAFERVCSGPADARSHQQKANLVRQLGVVPPAVLVGDTEADVLAAKLLGLGVIGVSSGMRNRRYLTDIGADVVVERVAQVPTVLDSVRGQATTT
jgi:phosphoglycolate phosphatase-like HAD superfamily hydrolase